MQYNFSKINIYNGVKNDIEVHILVGISSEQSPTNERFQVYQKMGCIDEIKNIIKRSEYKKVFRKIDWTESHSEQKKREHIFFIITYFWIMQRTDQIIPRTTSKTIQIVKQSEGDYAIQKPTLVLDLSNPDKLKTWKTDLCICEGGNEDCWTHLPQDQLKNLFISIPKLDGCMKYFFNDTSSEVEEFKDIKEFQLSLAETQYFNYDAETQTENNCKTVETQISLPKNTFGAQTEIFENPPEDEWIFLDNPMK